MMTGSTLPTGSSSERPVRMRLRADLKMHRQKYNGQTYWVVKDPVAMRYFRFKPIEFEIVRRLDGSTSLADLKEAIRIHSPDVEVTMHEILQLLGELHRKGLTVADAPGQGEILWQRNSDAQKSRFKQQLTNPFYIRLPAFDPQRFLNAVYPMLRFVFSPLALGASLCMMGAALVLVLSRLEEFQSRTSELSELLAAENWGLIIVAIAGTKFLHEFGHALTARHFRCECHTMGVMLLCFTPTIYTDVTDSWLLKNKWHRMAISAAGIYVELMIAAAATFVWWFTKDRTTHNLAQILMISCTIQTILANGNPLMRFDGYFVLMDWMEIPNLRDNARRLLLNCMAQIGLGIEPPYTPFIPLGRRVIFIVYALLANIYGWFVFYLILKFFLSSDLPREVRWIGMILAVMMIWNGAVRPLLHFRKWLLVPGRIQQIKRPNVVLTGGLLTVTGLCLWTIPTSETITCPVELRPLRSTVIVDRRDLKAVIPLHPRELTRIQTGQFVTIRFSPQPDLLLHGTIAEVVELKFNSSKPYRQDHLLAAVIPLEGLSPDWPIGCRGQATILVGHRSLATRGCRALYEMFIQGL